MGYNNDNLCNFNRFDEYCWNFPEIIGSKIELDASNKIVIILESWVE